MGVILAFIIAASVTPGGSEDPLALGIRKIGIILANYLVLLYLSLVSLFSFLVTCEEIEIMD